jgi:hypothetical protein
MLQGALKLGHSWSRNKEDKSQNGLFSATSTLTMIIFGKIDEISLEKEIRSSIRDGDWDLFGKEQRVVSCDFFFAETDTHPDSTQITVIYTTWME